MCARSLMGDRQSKSCAISAAGGIASCEWADQPRGVFCVQSRACIGHRNRDGCRSDVDGYVNWGHPVIQGVCDKVAGGTEVISRT